jgi:hypothetical protein
MTKITSIDALIDRIKEAYPNNPGLLARILDSMERDYPASAYNALTRSGFGRTYEHSVSHDKILECVGEDGNVIPEIFTKLVETVRNEIRDAELEPIRRQLDLDFDASYEFTWSPDPW